MANQPEIALYEEGILQWETATAALGGPGGPMNTPLLQLANRTAWLREQSDRMKVFSALAYKTSSQVIPNGATTPIQFGAVLYDDAGGVWTGGSPTRLTVPEGFQRVRLCGRIQTPWITGGERHIGILKNGGGAIGTPYLQLPPSPLATFDDLYLGLTGWLPVVPGDYFELCFLQSCGSTMTLGSTVGERQSINFFMEARPWA